MDKDAIISVSELVVYALLSNKIIDRGNMEKAIEITVSRLTAWKDLCE